MLSKKTIDEQVEPLIKRKNQLLREKEILQESIVVVNDKLLTIGKVIIRKLRGE